MRHNDPVLSLLVSFFVVECIQPNPNPTFSGIHISRAAFFWLTRRYCGRGFGIHESFPCCTISSSTTRLCYTEHYGSPSIFIQFHNVYFRQNRHDFLISTLLPLIHGVFVAVLRGSSSVCIPNRHLSASHESLGPPAYSLPPVLIALQRYMSAASVQRFSGGFKKSPLVLTFVFT